MPEDSGKIKFIKDFLVSVRTGENLVEDIWIDRRLRPPGSTGKGSIAQSLSGRPITTITELLEDDLRYCSEERFFVFRIISAFKGSGKTSLLAYLCELISKNPNYRKKIVVSNFSLSTLFSVDRTQNFDVKFYCYLLADTFYKIINDSELSDPDMAKSILSDYFGKNEISQLIGVKDRERFHADFISCFLNKGANFQEVFFKMVDVITKAKQRYTLVYLIDEFDGLKNRLDESQKISSSMRSIIKQVQKQFKSKVGLLIYFAGTTGDINNLLSQDSVIESIVGDQTVNLSEGYAEEFETIRSKIDNRIYGAFKRYKTFDKAWEEIKNIPLAPDQTLRGFCKSYASAILTIYAKHFAEAPESVFEGNARSLVEARCRQEWGKYLNRTGYELSPASTTSKHDGHNFDCYVELIHNGQAVSRCFGEAKNYELLTSHLETFDGWLKDIKKFDLFKKDPPDLAFLIAPSCPALLWRKLENKNIGFIQSDKIVDPKPTKKKARKVTSRKTPKQPRITIKMFKEEAKEKGIKIPSKITKIADIAAYIENYGKQQTPKVADPQQPLFPKNCNYDR